jgi:hypothetical protein
MNKKVIAMAIAATMAAPMAAQAGDTKVSGRVAGAIVSMDTGAGGVIGMADYGQGRLVFDYTDESGFFARYGVDIRLGRTGLGEDRDQYVGMKLGGGKLMLGRVGGVTKNLEKDPFIATFLELRNGAVKGGAYGSASFINQNIQYKAKMGGMNVGVEYILSDAATGADNGHYGVAISSEGDMRWYVGMNNGNGSGAANQSYTKAGIKMAMGGMDVVVGYDTDGVDDRIHAGVRMDMAGGMLDVTFADKGATVADSYTRIAFQKKASKMASWHAGYVINSGTGDGFGVGVIVKF